MPRIPSLDFTGPAQAIQSGGPVTSGAGQNNQGAALAQLGETISNLGSFMADQYVETKANRAVADSQKQLQDFTQQLQTGSVGENGEMVPPPTPDKHQELYEAKVKELRDNAESSLPIGGRAMRLFDNHFTTFSNQQGLIVQKNAIDAYHSEIKANTDESLDQDAVNFVDADPLQKETIKSGAYGRIDQLQRAGVYSPEEAYGRKKNFVKQSEVGSIIKIMQQNPDDVVTAIDAGEFKDLPAEMQQHWKSVALDRSEALIRRANAEDARLEAKQRRDETEVQNDTAKTAWTMHAKGNLTPAWVEGNRDSLAKDDYKTLLNAASGKDTTHSDPLVYSDLRIRAGNGEDVRKAAKQALAAGQLTIEHFNTLTGEVESSSVSAKGDNWQLRGKTFLANALAVNPNTSSGFEKEMLAKAIDSWTDWTKAHPTAKPEEARREYEAIAQESKVVSTKEMSIAERVPRYLKGGRGNVTKDSIKEAFQATKDAYERKEIDQYQLHRQAELLRLWNKWAKDDAPVTPK